MTAPHPSSPASGPATRAGASGRQCTPAVPSGAPSVLLGQSLPGTDGDRAFAEPWEAKAFGIVVSLSQSGHFSWAEWVACFSREVAAASAIEAAGGTPPTYYAQWLACVERLLVDRNVLSREELAARRFAIGAAGPAHRLR